MRVHPRAGFVALSAMVFAGQAQAEWRCDCTSIVNSCAATATVQDSFIEVTSNTEQCSRVDYFVDGTPLVALVVDGVERQDWISQSATPSIIIQSCQVCLDNASAEEPLPFASSLFSDGEPTLRKILQSFRGATGRPARWIQGSSDGASRHPRWILGRR